MSAKSIAERGHPLVWWIISVGLFIAIWELTFAMGLYSARTLPPPHVFLGDLPNQIQYFDFSKANAGEAAPPTPYHAVAKTISATVLRVVAGLGLGFVLGVVSGTLIRYFRWFGNLTLPTVTLLAPISPFAWLPVAVYLFGTGDKAGHLPGVPRGVLHHRAGHHRGDRRRQEDLPGGRPDHGRDPPADLFSGHPAGRTTRAVHDPAAQSVRGLDDRLIAESAGSDSGLGALVMLARNTGAANLVMVGMVVIGIVGFVFDIVLRTIQRRMLYWVPEVQASLQR